MSLRLIVPLAVLVAVTLAACGLDLDGTGDAPPEKPAARPPAALGDASDTTVTPSPSSPSAPAGPIFLIEAGADSGDAASKQPGEHEDDGGKGPPAPKPQKS